MRPAHIDEANLLSSHLPVERVSHLISGITSIEDSSIAPSLLNLLNTLQLKPSDVLLLSQSTDALRPGGKAGGENSSTLLTSLIDDNIAFEARHRQAALTSPLQLLALKMEVAWYGVAENFSPLV